MIKMEKELELGPVTISATVIVISQDMKALIIQRPLNKSFSGLWGVTGGKLNNEDGHVVSDSFRYFPAEDCAIRELYEETGIHVIRESLNYLCSIITLGEIKRLILSYYIVLDRNAVDVKIKIENSESQDYKWVTKEELKLYNFIVDIGGEITEVLEKIENQRNTEIERILKS